MYFRQVAVAAIHRVKTACAGLARLGVTLTARGALGDCHVSGQPGQTLCEAHAPARETA